MSMCMRSLDHTLKTNKEYDLDAALKAADDTLQKLQNPLVYKIDLEKLKDSICSLNKSLTKRYENDANSSDLFYRIFCKISNAERIALETPNGTQKNCDIEEIAELLTGIDQSIKNKKIKHLTNLQLVASEKFLFSLTKWLLAVGNALRS
ncbi:MAG: hypothetical protein WB791_04475 [Waddliaceae bacterium]